MVHKRKKLDISETCTIHTHFSISHAQKPTVDTKSSAKPFLSLFHDAEKYSICTKRPSETNYVQFTHSGKRESCCRTHARTRARCQRYAAHEWPSFPRRWPRREAFVSPNASWNSSKVNRWVRAKIFLEVRTRCAERVRPDLGRSSRKSTDTDPGVHVSDGESGINMRTAEANDIE